MTSNEKQFTVTRKMLTAVARDQRWPDVVAGISARFSKFAFVLFCYITNHLMTGPLENGEFCFPRISMFPSTSSRETSRFSGNKIHCSPRDQSLSIICCGNIVADANVSQFRRVGNMCCGNKFCCSENKKCFCLSQKHFCFADTNFASATYVSQFIHPGEHNKKHCFRNNVP